MSDMDFSDLTETDRVKLFLEIAKNGQINRENSYTNLDKAAIISYYYRLAHAASALNVSFDIKDEVPKPSAYQGIDVFYDRILDEIEKRKIDLAIARSRLLAAQAGITLDEPWREKVHSYLAHIRRIVTDASDLSAHLRQSILEKLNSLGAEVDRRQTRIQSFADMLVELCQGVSEGAIALKPAVVVGERIIGALARLKAQPPVLSLPSPENLALPSIEGIQSPTLDQDLE